MDDYIILGTIAGLGAVGMYLLLRKMFDKLW